MDDDPVRAVVRHPERREYTLEELEELRLAVIETELSGGDFIALGAVTGKDSFSRVRAILEYHRSGLYPRLSDLDWLADGLERWIASDGSLPLERCLGLRKPGQAGNPFKEWDRKRSNESALLDMRRLRLVFALKISDAAAIVAATLESTPHPLTESTLIDRYKRAAWLRDDPDIDAVIARRFASANARRELLSKFPRWSWQHLPELQPYL